MSWINDGHTIDVVLADRTITYRVNCPYAGQDDPKDQRGDVPHCRRQDPTFYGPTDGCNVQEAVASAGHADLLDMSDWGGHLVVTSAGIPIEFAVSWLGDQDFEWWDIRPALTRCSASEPETDLTCTNPTGHGELHEDPCGHQWKEAS